MSRQDKYTRWARGQNCTMRLPECCHDPETTVFAHVKRRGHGKMGGKPCSIHGAAMCWICHDIVDGRRKHDYEREWLYTRALEAVYETQEMMLRDGVLKL